MEIQINYINDTDTNSSLSKNVNYSRWKTYISEQMDDDMKNSTLSRIVDRIIINDAVLTSKKSVDDLIEFLLNSKESFNY